MRLRQATPGCQSLLAAQNSPDSSSAEARLTLHYRLEAGIVQAFPTRNADTASQVAPGLPRFHHKAYRILSLDCTYTILRFDGNSCAFA